MGDIQLKERVEQGYCDRRRLRERERERERETERREIEIGR
jgi:hypothetical protein